MTTAASHFIAPLTFASLTKHPVAIEMYPKAGIEEASGSWHIDWALWADAMVIAPNASIATRFVMTQGLPTWRGFKVSPKHVCVIVIAAHRLELHL